MELSALATEKKLAVLTGPTISDATQPRVLIAKPSCSAVWIWSQEENTESWGHERFLRVLQHL